MSVPEILVTTDICRGGGGLVADKMESREEVKLYVGAGRLM